MTKDIVEFIVEEKDETGSIVRTRFSENEYDEALEYLNSIKFSRPNSFVSLERSTKKLLQG